jgi:cytochrome c553
MKTLRLFLSAAVLCTGLHAADDENNATLYSLGETLYLKNGCNSCHGNAAQGSGSYPRLANRAKGFLAYRLRQFRSGKAASAQEEIMLGFASGLSDSDIDAITTFLSDYHSDSDDGERYERPLFDQTGDGSS